MEMRLLFLKIFFIFLIFQPVFALPIPGEKYFIDVNSLSEPYETKSVANSYNFVSENPCSLKAPKNFKVNLFAKNLDGPRNIKVASNDDVFVVESYTGNIKVLRDNDNDGKSDMEKIFAKGFNKPFGIDISNGFLYIADTDFVWKIPYIPGHLVQKSKAMKVTEPNALGDSSGHWTRNIAIKENKMYIAIGSRGNIEVEEYPRATIQELDLITNRQINFATGIRNPIGLDFHPITKKLFAVVNERDGMGDNLVPDYFSKINQDNFFGWPYFYLGNNIQPKIKIPKNFKKILVNVPDVLFKSHSGPIDFIFYNKKQFPKEYYGNAFVALHGSWNSSRPAGYMVARIPFKNNEPIGNYESFVTGFWFSGDKQANVCGRPAGLGISNDGSLLISDDVSNTIWRVYYSDN